MFIFLYVRNNCYLCLIAKKSIDIDYRALVCYMLPEGILDSFEIAGFKEEVTQEEDETRTVIKCSTDGLRSGICVRRYGTTFGPTGSRNTASSMTFPCWNIGPMRGALLPD